MLACGVPEFVIKDAVAAEITQDRKRGKDNRGDHKNPSDQPQAIRTVESANKSQPISLHDGSRKWNAAFQESPHNNAL
jgi:hypothetical protein